MANRGYQPISSAASPSQQEVMDRMDDDIEIPSTDTMLMHTVPWQSLLEADYINEADLVLIRRYTALDLTGRSRLLLGSDGPTYAEMLLRLVARVSHPDAVQYVLALLDQIMTQHRDHIDVFLNLADATEKYPFKPLLRVFSLHTSIARDAALFVYSKVLRVMALLLLRQRVVDESPFSVILRWTLAQLRKKANADILVAIGALQLYLRIEAFRVAFVKEDGLRMLANVIRTRGNQLQLLYQTTMCMWLLGYSPAIVEQFPHERGLIRTIVETLRMEEALKVRRICLATLRNLLGNTLAEEQMVDAGMGKLLAFLNERKWADPDMVEDLEALTDRLDVVVREMSSWERYKKEVLSGDLYWSPVHTNEAFWSQHAARLEDSDCRVLATLLEIIHRSTSPTHLAVACFDIGEYVRHRPRGRDVVTRLNGKEDFMKLMQHEDDEVRKHALNALQKIMVQNWDALRVI